MIRVNPGTLRLLALAILGIVLIILLARQSAVPNDEAGSSSDPPCFAAKLGFPCR